MDRWTCSHCGGINRPSWGSCASCGMPRNDSTGIRKPDQEIPPGFDQSEGGLIPLGDSSTAASQTIQTAPLPDIDGPGIPLQAQPREARLPSHQGQVAKKADHEGRLPPTAPPLEIEDRATSLTGSFPVYREADSPSFSGMFTRQVTSEHRPVDSNWEKTRGAARREAQKGPDRAIAGAIVLASFLGSFQGGLLTGSGLVPTGGPMVFAPDRVASLVVGAVPLLLGLFRNKRGSGAAIGLLIFPLGGLLLWEATGLLTQIVAISSSSPGSSGLAGANAAKFMGLAGHLFVGALGYAVLRIAPARE